MPDIRPNKRFYFVRDRDTGEVSVGVCWEDDWLGTKRTLWDVLLPGWHDYEDQAEFDQCCEIVAEIPAPKLNAEPACENCGRETTFLNSGLCEKCWQANERDWTTP